MYLTPTDKHWIIDCETNGLRKDATKVWVTCAENALTADKCTFPTEQEWKEWSDERIAEGCYFVGHNIIGFDAPVLNKLTGSRIGISRIIDTLLLSMLYSPNLSGGHSLDSWGNRLKSPKLEFDDWSRLTDEMVVYCQQDVALTKKLYLSLSARMRQVGFTERGCEIEHQAWHLIQNKQKVNGFPFDKQRAELLLAKLRQREQELKDEIYKLWPPRLEQVAEFARACKKDGSPSANFLRHSQQYVRLDTREDGSYVAFDWVEFNLGSPPQRVSKLLDLGWQPTSYTKAGNPQVDEDSLNAWAELSGHKEGAALAKWIVCNSRANMVNTWLNAYNEKTGAIHGDLWLAGTLRYRHSNPNSANIPAVRLNDRDEILYGEEGGWSYEARDLWTSGGDDWVLVGIDATGIQLRCLAHYIPDQAFRERILKGDQHKVNQSTLGLPNKASSKKFFYTTLMGGAGGRLAADQVQFGVNWTPQLAGKKKQLLIDSIPGFGALIEKLQYELEKTGRIKLIDGTPILVSSPHMVIPYLLQGDESRLMKQAAIYLDYEVRKNRLLALKAGDIHDEWQWRVHRNSLDIFSRVALPCFVRAGESFSYNVPIEGALKVGKTWAETH